MKKLPGLKLKKLHGGEIFLHEPELRKPFKPVGYIRELKAGWYSVTFESFPTPGGIEEIAEYLTYWGCVKPTPKQLRRYKRKMRKM